MGSCNMFIIDKIILGDNQFFGINHMSQEKAQQLSEKFHDISSIIRVYETAYDIGIKAFMLNSNDRAKEICEYFLLNGEKYPDIHWYPSIPYPHKYANSISERGIIPTIYEMVFKNNSAKNAYDAITKGSIGVFTKDYIKLMQLLVDAEMKMFHGLNYRVIFLQNIITDLILGYGIKEIFQEYCDYIRLKYKVIPGLITQNMPRLKERLDEWGITEVVICSSFNKLGYLMSPDVDSYIRAAKNNNPEKYILMAMSTLASGAILPKDAYDFINEQNIQSVVFGASTRAHISDTISLIKLQSHL